MECSCVDQQPGIKVVRVAEGWEGLIHGWPVEEEFGFLTGKERCCTGWEEGLETCVPHEGHGFLEVLGCRKDLVVLVSFICHFGIWNVGCSVLMVGGKCIHFSKAV